MIGARPSSALITINHNTSEWRYRLRDKQVGWLTMTKGQATAHLYRPKLLTTLQEGYGLGDFRRDLMAAVTVAIVALPLSMAIAVASGVSPVRGLYAAIVGGAVVSALGGSRFQIGGPAGAFIVLVAGTVARVGLEGLL